MRVIVIGSSGFFGSWLVPGLIGLGHEVVGFDVKDGHDLFNVEALAAAAEGCDAAIMLAAYPHFKPDIPATEFTRLNIIGPARVVEAMRAAKVRRLVYTSSGAVYGFGPSRPLNGWASPPIKEEDTESPNWKMLDAYSASKLATEAWLRLVSGRWLTVTALRINCIEPFHQGAIDAGAHWGWWCSQQLAISTYNAALKRDSGGFVAVNVGEPNENMDQSVLDALFDAE